MLIEHHDQALRRTDLIDVTFQPNGDDITVRRRGGSTTSGPWAVTLCPQSPGSPRHWYAELRQLGPDDDWQVVAARVIDLPLGEMVVTPQELVEEWLGVEVEFRGVGWNNEMVGLRPEPYADKVARLKAARLKG